MTSKPYAVFIGLPGVGKTTIGKQVAKKTKKEFVDTDQVLAKKHGPISQIFANYGEPRFRELEAETVRSALENSDGVVSLGGGAVTHPQTRELLQGQFVVYLETDLASVKGRLAASKRPLLQGDPYAKWKELQEERTPFYRSAAKLTYFVGRAPIKRIVPELLRKIEQRKAEDNSGRSVS